MIRNFYPNDAAAFAAAIDADAADFPGVLVDCATRRNGTLKKVHSAITWATARAVAIKAMKDGFDVEIEHHFDKGQYFSHEFNYE